MVLLRNSALNVLDSFFSNCLFVHFFEYFQEYKSFSLIMDVLKSLQQTFCICLPSTREASFWLLPLCFPVWNAVLVELPVTVPHPSSTPIPWRRAGQRIQMMSVILSLESEAWSRVTQGLKIVEADSSQWLRPQESVYYFLLPYSLALPGFCPFQDLLVSCCLNSVD